MRSDTAYTEIINAIEDGASFSPRADWYGFGSYFNGQGASSDIDLLAVCCADADGGLIRSQMASICEHWPVHLIIMTEQEESETDFIRSQGCIPLGSQSQDRAGEPKPPAE